MNSIAELEKLIASLLLSHDGNEASLSYEDGHKMGYLKGSLKILEDREDEESAEEKSTLPELGRILKRLEDKFGTAFMDHRDNEEKYTYWGGFDMGYLKSRIAKYQEWIYSIPEEGAR